MSGESVRPAVEHLSGILSLYENGDLDRHGYEELADTIESIDGFLYLYGNDDDLDILCGLASSINSNLYVARGYATSDAPRDIQYYQSMHEVRRIIKQVKRMG